MKLGKEIYSMPIIITEKRRAANRANAQNSTGPRTPEGKAASSKNAVRHGFCTNFVTIAEDYDDYEEIRVDYYTRFGPRDRPETDQVDRMAHCTWLAKTLLDHAERNAQHPNGRNGPKPQHYLRNHRK
jgi:hypothetical protein